MFLYSCLKKIHFFPSKHLVKVLPKLSDSFLSITLSCKDFHYSSSKDVIVCWSFSYCFLYLLYWFLFISYNIILPKDKVHADAVVIGITIKPIPVELKLFELDVEAIITNVSIDFNNVVIVFIKFLLGFVVLIFEVCNHFFNVNSRIVKGIDISQFFF